MEELSQQVYDYKLDFYLKKKLFIEVYLTCKVLDISRQTDYIYSCILKTGSLHNMLCSDSKDKVRKLPQNIIDL